MKLSFKRTLVKTPINIKIDRPMEEKTSNGLTNIPINCPKPPSISNDPTKYMNLCS